MCAGLARLLVGASLVARSSVDCGKSARYGGAIQAISSTPGRMMARVAESRASVCKAGVAELLPDRSKQKAYSKAKPLDRSPVARLSLGTMEATANESEKPQKVGAIAHRRGHVGKHAKRSMARQ